MNFNLLYLALYLKSPTKLKKLVPWNTNLEEKIDYFLGKEKQIYLEKAEECLFNCQNYDIGILTCFDEDYPPLLKEIADYPLLLFYKGNRNLLKKDKISVVGTRNPSLLALEYTKALCEYLALKFVIVSGMARGIDTMAHRSALNANGSTIGVLACGLDQIYPLSNHDLYEIASPQGNLLLLSEYPPKEKPLPFHFVKRNRIISGLSLHVVFVEGSEKSGAVITANYALDQNRNLYCFDHPAMSANGGCKNFIQQGAINLAKFFSVEKVSLLNLNSLSNLFYLGGNEWAKLQVSPKLFEEF